MKHKKGNISPSGYSMGFLADEFKNIQNTNRSDLTEKIETGFGSIDNYKEGWHVGDLVFIGSRPAMGKTAFILSLALRMIKLTANPILIFSLEMGSMSLFKRMVMMESEISSDKIRNNELTATENVKLNDVIDRFKQSSIIVDDNQGSGVDDIILRLHYYIQNFGIKVVFIDFIQLMLKASDDKNEMNLALNKLKEAAVLYEVLVVFTSSLPREVEESGDKRPKIEHITHLGNFSLYCDVISFLYRPEYYGFVQDENGESNAGRNLLIGEKYFTDYDVEIPFSFNAENGKFKSIY